MSGLITFYEKLSESHQKKTKLNSSVVLLSENKQSWLTFNFFHHGWQVSSLPQILDILKQYLSQWNNVTKSTKLHNGVRKFSGFTFK